MMPRRAMLAAPFGGFGHERGGKNVRKEVEVVAAAGDRLGEGVVWSSDEQRVLWTDILGRRLHRFDPSSGTCETFALDERLASFAPLGRDKILAGFSTGLKVLRLDDGSSIDIAEIEADRPSTRLNDGKLDRQGRFVFGTMDENPGGAEPIGSVWSYDGVEPPRALFGGVRISNSIAFSPDGRKLYFANTPTRRIDLYDYDPDVGTVGDRRLFVPGIAGEGYPDGSTVDADGCLWNAEWGGGRVVRYTPEGRIDRIVPLPCRYVTCCAFGGPDLSTLYITTARHDLDLGQLSMEPHAGSLFGLDAGVVGLSDARFNGSDRWK
jgi:L-arabinonolactonase